jgi:DNA-damage-inducible protein D
LEVNKTSLFKGKKIRKLSHEGDWWFSVIDVVEALTDSNNARRYWTDMKRRLAEKEGFEEVYAKCVHLKLPAPDGKLRETDCANTETLFRIIQSIPSPKAEPFKRWLAKIAKDRIDEIQDPELAMERMRTLYEQKGYPKDWVDKRVRGIAVRQDLTKEWDNRGVSSAIEYAILTNEIMKGTFELTVEEHKQIKGLQRANLRDHMNDLELILTMLAEATTTKITKDRDSKGFKKLKKDAQDGGSVAGRTRKDIELQSGKKVVSKDNFLPPKHTKKIKPPKD